jgi:trk system potassium uptake protein
VKAIIIGAGRVGFGIARELATDPNSIVVVDTDPRLIEEITTDLDVRGIVGNGAHPHVLEQAGARDADMVIAVTFSDEVNMIACQISHSLFDVPTKIARVRAQSYLAPEWSDLFSPKNMPIDVIISPEAEVARAIFRGLETPGAFDTMPFANGRVIVLGAKLDEKCPIIATPLDQLSQLFPQLKARIVAVKREGGVHVPNRGDQLMPGDEVYVVCDATHVERTLDILGKAAPKARRVVIVGGGNIGVLLAQSLEALPGLRIRLVEYDKRRAEHAAERLRRTIVLHGDGLEPSLLDEAGVADAELIIALTNDDKVNVLTSALAKDKGAKRAVCLINERTYAGLKSALGIDVFVDPRSSTISTILRHVRKGRITGLYAIADGEGEFIEGILLTTSPLVGKSLGDAGLGDGIFVAAIIRGDQVVMTDATTLFEVNDRLLVFAERDSIPKVEKLFRVAFEFH